MTNVERLRRADEIVQAALGNEAGGAHEMALLLAAECAGDALLRAEVESLLGYRDLAKDFIEKPAFALGAGLFADGTDTDGEDVEGRRVGPYQIVRELGRGGMGAVYLAERADGEFRQQVAVKIIRQTLAGAETRRHFKRERQILASLNHPNIARLLDGGMSDDGEPFLAMEYVEGVRIDSYADAHRLPTVARLNLFRQVCAAVQYAHQNLVIHRDLKPSNILVTAEGVPKLLDFGIAKLLDAEGEDAGAHTLTELGVMTPEYASPEQVRGESVTTASDVYSLGVVLYELLAGQRPYRIKSRKPDEIARAICEQEPSRPSQVSSEFGVRSADSKSSNPQAAILNPKSLRGDLDNIVLMAMRKEPARRYASVGQFSEDIRRHLDGLPVIARKDTLKYRSAKFIKRNKVGVAAAALVVLVLVGGIVAVGRQARVAAQERDRARVEAAKAARINEFLQSVFASANPKWNSSGFGQRGEVKVVDVLEQAGRRIEAELKDEPEIRAELHHTIGTTYLSLGQSEAAQTHFRAALDAYRGLYGERHPEVAEAIYYLAASVHNRRDFVAADGLFRQALEMFRAVDPHNTNVAYLLGDFAVNAANAGKTVAAEQAALEGLELSRQKYGDEHMLTNSLLTVLGHIYEMRGDLRKAETYQQAALANLSRMPNGRMLSYGALEALGNIAKHQGDFGRAETHYREALDIFRQTQNETHPDTIQIQLKLAEVRYLQGAYADAEQEAGSVLDLLSRSAIHKSHYKSRVLSLLSLIHARTNRRASAATFLRDALAVSNDLPDKDRHDDLLADTLVEFKREPEAKALLSKRLDYHVRIYGEQNPQAVITRKQLDRLDAALSRR